MKLVDKLNATAIAGSLLSLISSSLIIIFIPRSNGGLSTPYRRIIFGLSVSDVLQSLALVLGPFLLATDEDGKASGSSWAIGNVHTCDFQGFMATLGGSATCMYTLFLCLYYYCKLKRNMSDTSFTLKIEKKMHWFIVVVNMVVCLVALATKTFNPVRGIGTCQLVRKPFWCDPGVAGSCERGHFAHLISLYYFPVAVPCICLLGTLIFMILIAVHVSNQGILAHRQRMIGTLRNEEKEADYLARLLRREATLQVIFYGLAFLMTYGWIFAISLMIRTNTRPPFFLSVISAVTFPLMGIFNILIYTHPQVVAYRRLYSEVSWPVAFWLVIKAGGQNPDAVTNPTVTSPLTYRCISGPKFCHCLLCCFTPAVLEKESMEVMTLSHRFQAWIRCRFPSQMILKDPTKQAGEMSSPDIHPVLQEKTVMKPIKNGYSEEERVQDFPVNAGNECRLLIPERTDNQNSEVVLSGHHLSFVQNGAINRAFEKASQRADNMKLIGTAEKFVSTSTNESGWSNGVSHGSPSSNSITDFDIAGHGMHLSV